MKWFLQTIMIFVIMVVYFYIGKDVGRQECQKHLMQQQNITQICAQEFEKMGC